MCKMKKNYVKPDLKVYQIDMPMQIMSGSNPPSVTGDIGGDVNIGYGGDASNDPKQGQGGDAKSNPWSGSDDWDE